MATIFQQIFTQHLRNRSSLFAVTTAKRFLTTTSKTDNTSAGASKTFTKDALKKLVTANKVVIFMKGNPEQPQCGFSNAVVQVMRMHGVQYDAHDVLQNDELRQSIKDFSDWPTIPQIYINGDFIGGCDILLQMHQSGDLIEELEKVGIESLLLQKKAQDKLPDTEKMDNKKEH